VSLLLQYEGTDMMKVGLGILEVTKDKTKNLNQMLNMIRQAAESGADLVLFGEAAATGLINSDDPMKDVKLGEPIPGSTTSLLSQAAREGNIYVATGIFERDGNSLYDSSVLIDPYGKIVLKYRRISPGWHGLNANPFFYRHGESISKVETPLGTFAFLICGDLFDDYLTEQVKSLKVDWLLYPFARCFDDGSHDQERWDEEEKSEYVESALKTGASCIMVNYLSSQDLGDGNSFGGAMVVGKDGRILEEVPLGKAGLFTAPV